MTVTLPPPAPIRGAMTWLVVAAALQLLSGGATTLALAAIAYADPLLGGELSLPIFVAGVGGVLTLVGALVPLATASTLREGRPASRALLTIAGGALCLTPLLPVGAWMLWVAWGDEEVDAWFRALGA